jgi:hypothetical protein
MAVFVSSQAIDEAPAAELIASLRAAGLSVEHSPKSPAHGEGSSWTDWYQSGLRSALGRCSIFVAVVDRGWDSSTWMAIEAEEAVQKLGPARIRSFYWNPEARVITAKGMLPYLNEELSREVSEAVLQLREALGRMEAHHA